MNFLQKLLSSDKNKSAKEKNSESAGKYASEVTFCFPEKDFELLKQEDNSFFTVRKVPFDKIRELKDETIEKVFDFAYTMAFDENHRKNRSGGKIKRTNGEIFANTFQGKLAECAALNFFYKYDNTVKIDFDTYELGIWDKVDLTVCKKEVAVKSTKHFGQLLLLETKDWNDSGEYIPNIGTPNSIYDFIVMIRIEPSYEDIMKENRLLCQEYIDRTVLEKLIKHRKWSYDYVGYITNNDLKQIIKNNHILPQGALLNGKMPMDAENYYVQAGDMRNLSDFDKIFQKL